MNICSRIALRAGVAVLLAAGAMVGSGAPAQAADTRADLALDGFVGGRLAVDTYEKTAHAKIKNNGPGTPSELAVRLDTTQVPVHLALVVTSFECDTEPGHSMILRCPVPKAQIPGPGETFEFPIHLLRLAAGGDSFSIEFGLSIESPDDTTPSNNSLPIAVEFSHLKGVDLGVLVPDVKRKISRSTDPDDVSKAPLLLPGDETLVIADIVNQGDVIADGLSLKLTLPEGVTFTEDLAGCEYSADRRVAECVASSVQLRPREDGVQGVFPVKVAGHVVAPKALAGGTAEVAALRELPATQANLAKKRSALPTFLRTLAGPTVKDFDFTDNSDGFAVVVASEDEGDAPGGDGGSGGGDGDGDGGLPVTGPQAGLIGGIGAAALVAGGGMFLVARRRRVVLVTPGDEKPIA